MPTCAIYAPRDERVHAPRGVVLPTEKWPWTAEKCPCNLCNMGTPVSALPRRVRVKLAALAEVDDRTIAKVLRGDFVRGEPRERAIAALEAAGYQVPQSAREDPHDSRGPEDAASGEAEARPCR